MLRVFTFVVVAHEPVDKLGTAGGVAQQVLDVLAEFVCAHLQVDLPEVVGEQIIGLHLVQILWKDR